MNPSDPSSPPPSTRRAFDLVAKSPAMKRLIQDIARCSTKIRATPLLLGSNVLELRAFVRAVAAEKGFDERDIQIVKDESPLLLDTYLFDEDLHGLVFQQGDKISSAIQTAFVDGRIARRIHLFLPIVTMDAGLLVKNGTWTHSFYRSCTRTFRWPDWSERIEDHDELIAAMRARLPDHALDRGAAQYLKGLRGTEDTFTLLRQGVVAARQDANADGRVTLTHLITAREEHKICVHSADPASPQTD